MANATDAEAAQAANAISDDVHLSDQLHEQMGAVINEALVVNYPCLLSRWRGFLEAGASCFYDAVCRY